MGAGAIKGRESAWAGGEIADEIDVGSLGGPREWCRVWSSNNQGTEMPGASPISPLGRMTEPQIDAHSQTENVLITHSAGDGSSEEEQRS